MIRTRNLTSGRKASGMAIVQPGGKTVSHRSPRVCKRDPDNYLGLVAYRRCFRPLFFQLDPQVAHHLAMVGLKIAGKLPLGLQALEATFDYRDPRLESQVFGQTFRNPIGLAAGYDKDAETVREVANLGFGHLEIGTVTPRAQNGNEGKKVFRFPEDEAVINRMGFPNQGAEPILRRLKKARARGVNARIGVNIGKNRNAPLELASSDYGRLLKTFSPYADYIVINVSSPNTAGLRRLQAKDVLEGLLKELVRVWQPFRNRVPLLLKIAPDLSHEELDDILDLLLRYRLSGIVATNTTIGRKGLLSERPERHAEGGLSGKPLRWHSTQMIRYIYQRTEGKLPIIGIGGIDSVDSALEKIQAGASLVELFTGMIFQGPALVRSINRGLAERITEMGASNVSELVGTM